MKVKHITEAQFLALLEKVLSKTLADSPLATVTYEEVAKQVRLINSISSLEQFCEKGSIPNLQPETVAELKNQLCGIFGEPNVSLVPEEDEKAVDIEITLPDRTVCLTLKVQALDEDEGTAEAPFVPFPVALPEDLELVWSLARRENLGPDEAARALAAIEEEFWASKKGQILQREGVAKSFAEFISSVPAAALMESGIKRYHKDPETLKTLRFVVETGTAQITNPTL